MGQARGGTYQWESLDRTAEKVPSTSDTGTAAANTNATVTLSDSTAEETLLFGVAWSYSATPTGGRLTIQDGTNVVFDLDITAGGEGSIYFGRPKRPSAGNNLVVTLYAGGNAVVGKVNAL